MCFDPVSAHWNCDFPLTKSKWTKLAAFNHAIIFIRIRYLLFSTCMSSLVPTLRVETFQEKYIVFVAVPGSNREKNYFSAFTARTVARNWRTLGLCGLQQTAQLSSSHLVVSPCVAVIRVVGLCVPCCLLCPLNTGQATSRQRNCEQTTYLPTNRQSCRLIDWHSVTWLHSRPMKLACLLLISVTSLAASNKTVKALTFLHTTVGCCC